MTVKSEEPPTDKRRASPRKGGAPKKAKPEVVVEVSSEPPADSSKEVKQAEESTPVENSKELKKAYISFKSDEPSKAASDSPSSSAEEVEPAKQIVEDVKIQGVKLESLGPHTIILTDMEQLVRSGMAVQAAAKAVGRPSLRRLYPGKSPSLFFSLRPLSTYALAWAVYRQTPDSRQVCYACELLRPVEEFDAGLCAKCAAEGKAVVLEPVELVMPQSSALPLDAVVPVEEHSDKADKFDKAEKADKADLSPKAEEASRRTMKGRRKPPQPDVDPSLIIQETRRDSRRNPKDRKEPDPEERDGSPRRRRVPTRWEQPQSVPAAAPRQRRAAPAADLAFLASVLVDLGKREPL